MFFNAPMMRDGSVATYLMYMAYTIGVQRSDGQLGATVDLSK